MQLPAWVGVSWNKGPDSSLPKRSWKMHSGAKGEMLPQSCIAKFPFGFFFFFNPPAPDPVLPHLKGLASLSSPPKEPLPGGPRRLGFRDAGTGCEGDPPQGRRQGPGAHRREAARRVSEGSVAVGRGVPGAARRVPLYRAVLCK